MKKPKKVENKSKSTLRKRLLRRWRNSSLRVKELSRMEFGERKMFELSKEKLEPLLHLLERNARSQDRKLRELANTTPFPQMFNQGAPFPACPTCHRSPQGPYGSGLGALLGRIL